MILLILLIAALVIGTAVGAVIRRAAIRAAVAILVVVAIAAYALYATAIAPCPAHGECERGLTAIFLTPVAAGWVLGVFSGFALRRALGHGPDHSRAAE